MFTDMDGTLLDHHSYRWQAASDALALLRRWRIPLIINTSKTTAETRQFQQQLAPGMPFIVENGAAVVVPDDDNLLAQRSDLRQVGEHQAKVFGQQRATILEVLQGAKSRYDFVGFSEMTVDDLIAATQLQPEQAELALQRDYSEPLIWRDSPQNLALLREELAEQELAVTQGGRFVHIAGKGDKGSAMRWLAENAANTPKHIIALGDSENDRPMLEQSDWPVVIATPAHAPLNIDHPRAITTQLHGPEGWNTAIQSLLTNTE